MSAALDTPDLLAVLDRYRTCEFATVGRSGVPIAWPTVARYQPGDRTFLITTSIGFPQKAYNVRRTPKVALLFSDPTGSGLAGGPQVLIRGEADCPDTVDTSASGLEEYWVRVFERQPFSRRYGTTVVSRRAMDWYYRRLRITVAVRGVQVRPSVEDLGRISVESAARRRRDAFGRVARNLAGYRSAVLVARDGEGFPWMQRLRPEVDVRAGEFVLPVPPGERLHAGPASLLCHQHNANLWLLRSFVAVGELAERAGRWTFTCERVVPGMSRNPLLAARIVRQCRRSAKDYLQRRGLPAPPVPWSQYNALKDEAVRRQTP
jgi:Pyridoxamine 5'-phosphate oxidase